MECGNGSSHCAPASAMCEQASVVMRAFKINLVEEQNEKNKQTNSIHKKIAALPFYLRHIHTCDTMDGITAVCEATID